MLAYENLEVRQMSESKHACDCCGGTSKTIWGDISDEESVLAAYFVRWTVGSAEHYPSVDLVLGKWGDGTGPDDRCLIAITFRPSRDGGSFMVVDAAGRPADRPTLCARALRRAEVVGTELAADAFAMLDAIWINDPRIEEVKALCLLT